MISTAPGALAAAVDPDLDGEFPIKSETTYADRRVLLAARELLHAMPVYSYAEIGSYLGGSLVPFLRDPRCVRVLSIDERGRLLPDERGRSFDYTHVTEQMMLSGLARHCENLRKLETFDGPVSAYPAGSPDFDLLFIDGEHTDRACFRDFLVGRKLLKRNAMVLFHDSTLIHKALLLIRELLAAAGEPYRMLRVQDSEISILLLNGFCSIDIGKIGAVDTDMEEFHRRSEEQLLAANVRNRLSVPWLLREAAYRFYVRLPDAVRLPARGLKRLFTRR